MTRGQNEQALANVLADPGVHKIVLKRKNRIKTYVSSLIAEQSGQWEVYSDADLIEPRPKVELSVSDVRRHMAENEAHYSQIKNVLQCSAQNALAVAYEDLDSSAEHSRCSLTSASEIAPLPWLHRASSRIQPTSAGWSQITTKCSAP